MNFNYVDLRKILYIIPEVKIGGAETIFVDVEEFKDDQVIFLKYNLNLKDTNLFTFIVCFIKYFQILLKIRPDIVISSLWKAHLFALLGRSLFGFKTVPFIHSSRFFSKIDRFISSLMLWTSDNVFVDSERAKSFINSAFASVNIHRISVVSLTPEYSKFHVNRKDFIRMLFLGRIHPIKRIDLIFEFLRELDSFNPEFNVTIELVGPIEKHSKNDYELLCKQYNEHRVLLKDPVSRLSFPELFLGFDYIIQFSEVEGMALSVIESMSYGLIPLVSNVGEIDSYAINNHNAFLLSDESGLKEVARQFIECERNLEIKRRLSINAVLSANKFPKLNDSFRCELYKIL